MSSSLAKRPSEHPNLIPQANATADLQCMIRAISEADGSMHDVPYKEKMTEIWGSLIPRRCKSSRLIDQYFALPLDISLRSAVYSSMRIYSFTTYYINLFYLCHPREAIPLDWIDSLIVPEAREAAHLDSVGAIVMHEYYMNKISDTICHLLPAIDTDKLTRKWRNVFKASLEHDTEEIGSLLVHMLGCTATKIRLMKLKGSELSSLLSLLQTLIDYKCSGSGYLGRFMLKLMNRAEPLNIPSQLLIDGVTRLGTNPIAGGGFADIWQGKMGRDIVAVKIPRMFGNLEIYQATLKDICREAIVWKLLDHDFVCPFYGMYFDDMISQYAMVLPWMPNGNFVQYLEANPDVNRKKIVAQVASGLCYLHSHEPQVVHGDFRLVNILADDSGKPLITDFGLCRIIDSHATTAGLSSFAGKGSVRWQAPELLAPSRVPGSNGNVTAESDVYAFACVCLEIFTDEVPWYGYRDGMVITKVCLYGERPPRPPEPAATRGLDNSLWRLMKTCWSTAPEDRPNMSSIERKLIAEYVGDRSVRGAREVRNISTIASTRSRSRHTRLYDRLSYPRLSHLSTFSWPRYSTACNKPLTPREILVKEIEEQERRLTFLKTELAKAGSSGTCVPCKQLQLKCEYKTDKNLCRQCINSGRSCLKSEEERFDSEFSDFLSSLSSRPQVSSQPGEYSQDSDWYGHPNFRSITPPV